MCYNPVFILSNHYLGKKTPSSKEYNLQIDALVLVNYVALSSKAFDYCPYPILYDKESGKEITSSSTRLEDVIQIYKNWFQYVKNH